MFQPKQGETPVRQIQLSRFLDGQLSDVPEWQRTMVAAWFNTAAVNLGINATNGMLFQYATRFEIDIHGTTVAVIWFHFEDQFGVRR